MEKIYFEATADFTSAVAWVYNPYKKLANGSAYKYILLQQVNETHSGLLAYGSGDAWLYRVCPSQGPIGTAFLFDGSDVAKRVASGEAWKRYPLSLSTTKRSKLKLEAIGQGKDSLLIAGNIELNSYNGDLADFELPQIEEWHYLTSIGSGWEYLTACSLISKFSKLESKKDCEQVKGVWFRFKDNKLSLTCSEEGNKGNSIICYELNHIGLELSFAIHGGYLMKTAQVFGINDVVKIEVDNLEKPNKIKFSGDKGWIIVNTIEDYLVQEVSRGAMAMFYSEGITIENINNRVYDVTSLKDAVSFQVPQSDSTVNDFLIEEVNSQLVMSKLYDAEKFEMSTANPWSLDYEGEWQAIVVSFNYVMNSLNTLDKFITREVKNSDYEQVSDEDIDYDNEDFITLNDIVTQKAKLIRLQQSKFKSKNKDRWILFLDSPTYPQCKTLIICSLPEHLKDYVQNE
jgi:hypothetical protein